MNMTVEDLLTDALKLTEEDRFELAEALMASIYQDKLPPVDDALLALIQRRCDELDSGAVVARSHEEVMATLKRVTGCD